LLTFPVSLVALLIGSNVPGIASLILAFPGIAAAQIFMTFGGDIPSIEQRVALIPLFYFLGWFVIVLLGSVLVYARRRWRQQLGSREI